MTIEVRPDIATITTSAELRRWYWLKKELSAEANRLGVKCSGAKFTIQERLCHFHDTGVHTWPGDLTKKVASNFDWHRSILSRETIITDNYKNTQNVRRFFKSETSEKFSFNIELMEWLTSNTGKTLGDAIIFWRKQNSNPKQTKIKPHNQFNQYCRDFADANPGLSMKDARKAWATKRTLPSENGKHRYEPSDLNFLD